MAIVQAGNTFTAADLKATAGNLASQLRNFIQMSEQFRTQLVSWVDADLVALGLTQPEVDAMKGFFNGDMPSIRTSFNASVWLLKLLGKGV